MTRAGYTLHNELITKWIAGAQIEEYDIYSGKWCMNETPDWGDTIKYRLYKAPRFYNLTKEEWLANIMDDNKVGFGVNADLYKIERLLDLVFKELGNIKN